MNNKESVVYQVLDIVVDCCSMEIDGVMSVTKEDVLSRDRRSNVVMTRCIFITEMVFLGYTTDTIAAFLHRTNKDIRHLLNTAHSYRTSKAYVIAEAEATLKCKNISM